MPSRRSHTNSHHGCLRCKSKRVKCDQTQPTCLRCQRRGAECIYRHILTSYDPFRQQQQQQQQQHAQQPQQQQPYGPPVAPRRLILPNATTSPRRRESCSEHSSSLTSISSPTGSGEGISSSFQIGRDDQHLLHHYMNNLTIRHMAPVLESSLFPILSPAITRNAVMHPYVQQAVLCYSALHLASATGGGTLTQQSSFLVAALRHKAMALAHFRPLLASGVTAQNCEAAFTASAVLVACAFALPVADPLGTTACDRIELLAQVVGLFRGCLALFRMNWSGPHPLEQFRSPQVRQSITASYSSEISWPDAEKSVEEVLNVIKNLDQSDITAQKRKASLLGAATSLHKVIRRVAASESDYSVVCMWLGKVNPEYVNLLRSRDPLALVLMAHWCAARNHYSEDVWWTKGWPESALTSILVALNGQYTELLDWCLAEVGIGLPAAPAQSRPSPRIDEYPGPACSCLVVGS